MKLKNFLAIVSVISMCNIGMIYKELDISEFSNISVSAEEFVLENGLSYEVNEDGTGIIIIGCDTSAKEIEIPAEIDGLPVTTISESSFEGCNLLTSIKIPDSVTSIKTCAFENCSLLTEVIVPDSVEEIGVSVFEGTPFLENQTSDVKYAGKCVIKCSEDATKAELKSDTIGIASCAFIGCDSLTEIIIPDSVRVIGEQAFAFSSIKSIVIPNGVTSIEGATFAYCESLKEITIPASVKNIGYDVFNYCRLLKDVYFQGSEEEWNNITIMDNSNEVLLNVKIHFLEESEQPTGDIDGNGETTSNDALNILQIVANVGEFTEEQKALADLNGDGEITSLDALKLLQMIVGIE